ncbi:hypothetical protein MSKU9_1662 [Komagataeibacter diospyri]|uniref:Uncharacterized protein n=1 Tax=Komagataeibacter diospyri TaxID=1932662 RepID=A0A4P5NUH0_9PROT|nr:hypothetical protein MSKU9_1662 [Komagataeibacter diospyri]
MMANRSGRGEDKPDGTKRSKSGTILNFVRCSDNLLEEEPPHEH